MTRSPAEQDALDRRFMAAAIRLARAHQGLTSDKVPGRYDKQVAIFSQVANPLRDHGPERSDHPDNTLIFYKSKFHWAWFIPLDDETASLGVVAPGAYDAISAMMIEQAGFPAVYMTGSGTAASEPASPAGGGVIDSATRLA